jgi:hypothetical protein
MHTNLRVRVGVGVRVDVCGRGEPQECATHALCGAMEFLLAQRPVLPQTAPAPSAAEDHIHDGGRPGVPAAASEVHLAAPAGYAVVVAAARKLWASNRLRVPLLWTCGGKLMLHWLLLRLMRAGDGLQQQGDYPLLVECIHSAVVVGTDVSLQTFDRVGRSTSRTVEAHWRSLQSLIAIDSYNNYGMVRFSNDTFHS